MTIRFTSGVIIDEGAGHKIVIFATAQQFHYGGSQRGIIAADATVMTLGTSGSTAIAIVPGGGISYLVGETQVGDGATSYVSTTQDGLSIVDDGNETFALSDDGSAVTIASTYGRGLKIESASGVTHHKGRIAAGTVDPTNDFAYMDESGFGVQASGSPSLTIWQDGGVWTFEDSGGIGIALSSAGGVNFNGPTVAQNDFTVVGTFTLGASNQLSISGDTTIGSSSHTVTLNTSGNTSITLPTSGTLATQAYADALFAANDALLYKGVINCSANPNYPAADAGHLYRVSVAGKIGGASGTNVEVGDTLICITDSSASGDQATVGANWNLIQSNLDGAVIGPASSTASNIAIFSGTTGKLLADGGKALPSGTIVGTSDTQTLSNKSFSSDVLPSSNNSAALGTGSVSWADLFLANGGVIGWANGAATLTHVSATDSLDINDSDLRIVSPGTHSTSVVTRSVLASPPAIGNTAAAAGTFTTLAATSFSISSKALSLSGNTTIGSSTHTVAFATSGNTSVTLPTSGTLVASGSTPTFNSLTLNDSGNFASVTLLSTTAPSNGSFFGLDGADNFHIHQRESGKVIALRHTNSTKLEIDTNGVKLASTMRFDVTDDGNSGTSKTINWGSGNRHKLTLTGNVTLTFTAPSGDAVLSLILVQDGTGSRLVTWPSSVKWPGGTAPTLSTGASKVDIVTLIYNSAAGHYYAQAAMDFR